MANVMAASGVLSNVTDETHELVVAGLISSACDKGKASL